MNKPQTTPAVDLNQRQDIAHEVGIICAPDQIMQTALYDIIGEYDITDQTVRVHIKPRITDRLLIVDLSETQLRTMVQRLSVYKRKVQEELQALTDRIVAEDDTWKKLNHGDTDNGN
jgi:hypothetical protein